MSEPEGDERPWRRGDLRSSLGYAVNGLRQAFGRERNLRIHAGVTVLVVSWALVLGLSWTHLLWLALAIALVLVSELFNTALEIVVDMLSPGPHPLAGMAKDIAAGAVLVACGFAVLVGLVVLGPSLWERMAAGLG